MIVVRVSLIAAGALLVGCYQPANQDKSDAVSSADSNRYIDGAIDGRTVDSAQVDAAPGLPSLARAPKTCEVSVADPIVQLAPLWKGDVSMSDLQGLSRIFYQCNEVWAVSNRFAAGNAPPGAEPSIVLKRREAPTPQSFVMAYTVEGILQQGEANAAFAGGFALTANTTQFSLASIQRDPVTGSSSLVTATQAGIASTLALGNPTPPYRLHWSSVRMGDQLSTTLTLYTATTTQQFPAQVMPLVSNELILQIGVNRYKGGLGTKMTISDLELP